MSLSKIVNTSNIFGKFPTKKNYGSFATLFKSKGRVSTDPGNPGYPGKTLEFKRILEFLEKPWNSVENPGKITLKSIFVDICRYFVDWVDRICS